MKAIAWFIKTTLVGGLLFVVPVWLSVVLLLKALSVLGVFVRPITDELPRQVRHPRIAALFILVLGCILIGWMVHTALGRWLKQRVERYVLEKIPGYSVIRGVTGQIAHTEEAKGFEPALAEIEDALVPAFIVERHDSGRCTVFVPSAPTPAVGSIYILTPERVHPVDVPLLKQMTCISKWGAGCGVLLDAMRTAEETRGSDLNSHARRKIS